MKEINDNADYDSNSANPNDPFTSFAIHMVKLHEEKVSERIPDAKVIYNILSSPLPVIHMNLI